MRSSSKLVKFFNSFCQLTNEHENDVRCSPGVEQQHRNDDEHGERNQGEGLKFRNFFKNKVWKHLVKI